MSHLASSSLNNLTFSHGVDASSSAEWPVLIPNGVLSHGTTVHTRRGQPLPLSIAGEETVFVVRMATLLFRLTLPGDLRQGVSLLYPGDVFRSAFVPPGGEARLLALTPGEVLRFRFDAFSELMAAAPAARAYFDLAVARQMARQAIHLAAIGQLDCFQRLVTFLMELALHTGAPASDGRVVFEMPLSRSEIAEYLGVNADTLSRIMSRLRGEGLLIQPDRHTVYVSDLEALAALSPASPALMSLCGGAAPEATDL